MANNKKAVTRLALQKYSHHWFDYVVFALHATWSLLGITTMIFQSEFPIWAIAAGTIGYLLCCTVPFYCHLTGRPGYAAMTELAIAAALYLTVPLEESAFNFFNIPALMIGYLAQGRQAFWAFPVAFVLPLLLAYQPFSLPSAELFDKLINVVLLMGIGFCFQTLINSYRKINGMYEIIREQNQTLEAYSKQIEKLTLAEERNRLSRELHDTVGHTFTTTITGMDAVYYLIDLAPDEAKKSLKELLHVTRSGLDDVRKHIHEIADQDEEQSLVERLTAISDQFANHAGINVSLRTEGTEYPVSEMVYSTFIRCLQEALTNAKRHGNATAIRVTLTFGREQLTLEVQDNGRGDDNLTKGFGLQAMTNRLTNVNGRLQITSSASNGTVILCSVPVFASHAS